MKPMYLNARLDDSEDFLNLQIKVKDAITLFHDANRMLSLIDDCINSSLGELDQKSYDRIRLILIEFTKLDMLLKGDEVKI